MTQKIKGKITCKEVRHEVVNQPQPAGAKEEEMERVNCLDGPLTKPLMVESGQAQMSFQPKAYLDADENPLMRNEYLDVDEDPNEDNCLMPRADLRCAVWFKMCGANQDAQEKEENLDETPKTKMRRKLLSFVCIM